MLLTMHRRRKIESERLEEYCDYFKFIHGMKAERLYITHAQGGCIRVTLEDLE